MKKAREVKATIRIIVSLLVAVSFASGCATNNGSAKVQVRNAVASSGEGETPVELLKKGEIVYPLLARARGIEGELTMEIRVDARGLPVDIKVVKRKINIDRAVDLAGVVQDVTTIFDESAINMFKASQWKPASKNGTPMAVTVQVPLKFFGK